MTYIDRMDSVGSIFGLGLNTRTGALYSGFFNDPSAPPDGQMLLAGAGNALPTVVGNITFGAAPGTGIYTNKAFLINTQCNFLFACANSEPAAVNFFDLGQGSSLPVFKGNVTLPTDEGQAGAIE